MNSVLAFLLKFTGVGFVWDKLDGYKTYGAAALGILTSLAGLGVELAPILSAHNTAALLTFVQGLPHDASWLGLVAAFGLLGVGHKLEKAADASGGVPLPNQAAPPAA